MIEVGSFTVESAVGAKPVVGVGVLLVAVKPVVGVVPVNPDVGVLLVSVKPVVGVGVLLVSVKPVVGVGVVLSSCSLLRNSTWTYSYMSSILVPLGAVTS